MMAETWGTPMPATMRVVQMDPGTDADLDARPPRRRSTPGPFAGAHVAGDKLHVGEIPLKRSPPDDVAGMPVGGVDDRTSAPASSRPGRVSIISSPTPMAAPTRSRPMASLQALGYFLIFSISLMVIMPVRRPFLSTTSSFSMRCS
jgi:hypothetical protein